MTGASVIRMAMGDDGAINPAAHRVDVEIARRAVEPFRRGTKQVFGADHAGNMMRLAWFAKYWLLMFPVRRRVAGDPIMAAFGHLRSKRPVAQGHALP